MSRRRLYVSLSFACLISVCGGRLWAASSTAGAPGAMPARDPLVHMLSGFVFIQAQAELNMPVLLAHMQYLGLTSEQIDQMQDVAAQHPARTYRDQWEQLQDQHERYMQDIRILDRGQRRNLENLVLHTAPRFETLIRPTLQRELGLNQEQKDEIERLWYLRRQRIAEQGGAEHWYEVRDEALIDKISGEIGTAMTEVLTGQQKAVFDAMLARYRGPGSESSRPR